MSYPEKIYAVGVFGTNGIECLNFQNFDEDIEYIRADHVKAIENRLRGQLQNCINHLDKAKHRHPNDESYSKCIESANKALYETSLQNSPDKKIK